MSDQPSRPRRRGRPRKAESVAGAHHLEGDRRRYLELAGQLEILAFTVGDELFLQREDWIWDQLWELAQRRGLVSLVEDDAPSDAGF